MNSFQVLLVDDDDVDRLHVRRTLRGASVTVHLTEVADADSALAALEADMPDCMLLDLHLPGKDGLWMLQQLRERDLSCPTIVLTGNEDAELVVDVMRAGAFDYLHKSSLTAHRLSHSIASAVDSQRIRAEARRVQAELVESESRFRNIADHAPVMLWLTDDSGSFTYISRRWYEFTGSAIEQSLGLAWLETIHPDDAPQVAAAFVEASAAFQAYDVEYRMRGVHGEYCWFLSSAVPRFDAAGLFLGYVGSVVDVTERKKAEDQRAHMLELESRAREESDRANRVKDEFLAVVSHELRTPLSAILGWVQMLRSGAIPEERQDMALETIERNARSQSKLIEDILDVSRIMSGKLQLATEHVGILSIVEQALNTVRPAAEAKSIALDSVLDSDGTVLGDPTRLQQIVWNLLSNAVKFTPSQGRVTLTLRRLDGAAEIQITDTGDGIPLEFLPFVFEPFRQAEGGPARRTGGLGLGLAIVRNLVELHGGAVSVFSDGRGRGSSFQVSLPLVAADPPLPASEKTHRFSGIHCPPQLKGLHVLVVDDEADIRELLRTILESCELRVTCASGAAQALELLQSQRPNVLISDIGMPDEDGYSLIRKLRRLAPDEGGKTPAIALSAYARGEDRTAALVAGFSSHLAKPVEATELLAVVASLTPKNTPSL